MWPFRLPYPVLRPDEVGIRVSKSPSEKTEVKESSAFAYDYIIVGGGTAGCVLASRLSEIPDVSVLVIERGGVIKSSDMASLMPLISSNFFSKGGQAQSWDAEVMPELNNGKSLRVISGGGVGGASLFNGMAYTRGSWADYDNWREVGHPDWSSEALLPYFIKSETNISRISAPTPFRGNEGPWKTQSFRDRVPIKAFRFALEASPVLGIPIVPDLNSPDAPAVGSGYMEFTVDEKMRRSSTYQAFLPKKLALDRHSRLKICTHSMVTRVDIKKDVDGHLRACGVFFEAAGGQPDSDTFYATAKHDIILSCGALGSPHLLQLSGVGPAQHLRDVGIDTVLDLPGVGGNLQDHLSTPVQFKVPLSDSLHRIVLLKGQLFQTKIYVLLCLIWEIIKYVLLGRGLLCAAYGYVSIFVKSDLLSDTAKIVEDVDPCSTGTTPDIELLALPCTGEYPVADVNVGYFSFNVTLLRSKSVGSVRLASKDPRERPICKLGYFTDPADYTTLRKGIRLALRYGEQMKAQGYPIDPLVVPETDLDEEINRFIQRYSKTSYHYMGTCRMGRPDEARPGVVDDELRVHGIGGLRVCDASVFPEIVTAHTMAPTVVVAEKCADILKKSFGTTKDES